MASKSAGTKTIASKVKAAPQKAQKEGEAPEKEAPETPDAPLPLLDLSDAAVKKMIKQAKKRGYVTYEQLNSVMPSEEVTSEQIEDVLAMMSEMGINVVETEEAEADGEEEAREEPEEEEAESGELVEVTPKTPAKSETKEPTERTDDPVRMYLREMGSVELLSREGEIAIAKRIEAGREAMIAGLCESPLTFQAVIIWRDELNEGKVFLRDIIDLEATYAGPDAKAVAAPVPPGGDPAAAGASVPGVPGFVPQPPQAVAPPSAPPAATPFKPHNGAPDGDEALPEGALGEPDLDEDDLENSMSLAAIEAELKPKVLETFDTIAELVQAPAPPARAGHPQQAALDRAR
jgi:RNA polymerase primary sigma factor